MSDFNLTDDLQWTSQAQVKLKMIPFFARPQARQRIEAMARAADLSEITAEMVVKARSEFGQ